MYVVAKSVSVVPLTSGMTCIFRYLGQSFLSNDNATSTVVCAVPRPRLPPSVGAPKKARFVYKHLWYPNQKYWNDDSRSFHIHVFRQTEPKIIIRFGFNVNKIEWSEEEILSMKRKLSEIASLLGMEAKMNRAVFAIEREFDHVEKSAECLTALIPKVKLAIVSGK